MRTRRTLGKRCCVWVNALIIMIAVGFGGLPESKAQEITSLIEFTNVWKYDRSGLELGSAWRTNDFDDSAWPSGPGLLGLPGTLETSLEPYLRYAPFGFGTAFPSPLSQTVTTYYFRTTFDFPYVTNQVRLFATNLVDDGCVIWLNGQLVGRINMNPTFNAATFAALSVQDGELAVRELTNYLRTGVNQLAVEVHQGSSISSDVAFGMKLTASRPSPLVITNQPKSQTVLAGEPVVLRVDVDGGVLTYRWQKDGINLSSTSNTVVISSAQLQSAGGYRVICTGPFNSVTSSVATLTVLADLIGPTVYAAIEDNGFGPGLINISFSEALSSLTARSPANYSLKRLGSDRNISLGNVLYSTVLGAVVFVDPSDPDWLPDADYVLTINNVMDPRGNAILPNTQVPVRRAWRTNIVDSTAIWSWHARYSADPGIYQQSWSTPGYVEDPQFWFSGVGPFCGGAVGQPPCGADCESTIDYQLSPTLFRTTFLWPENLGTNGQLIVSGAADDGLVLFLNGTRIWRTNFTTLTAFDHLLTVVNYAASELPSALCFSDLAIPVTALLPGTNCLAAAVLQPRTSTTFESAFSLTAVAQAYVAKPLAVDNTPPTLRVESLPNNAARLSWEGNGFALEYVTNLTDNAASYPAGPWIQAPGMSNPYTNRPPSPSRIFRLKK
jgi:hypothetical protein